MNFGSTYDSLAKHAFLTPYMTLKHNGRAIDLYKRLSGSFEYFTAAALKKVGLLDERFINALEHCEHTYRMSLAGMTTPFNAFADLHRSYDYIEDQGTCTTIVRNMQYKKRLRDAFELFTSKHGMQLRKLPKPTD